MRKLIPLLLSCVLWAQPPQEAARVQGFQTTAKLVRRGATVTLRWSVSGTDQVRLEPLGLILPARGEITHVVTGRMVYWLHVSNAVGGQSVPLVVDLLPEEAAPALPISPSAPFAPPALQPLALAPVAKLAALPAVPATLEPALPVVMAPVRRVARHRLARRVYIQYAVMVSSRSLARLQRNLHRLGASDSTLVARSRRSGRPFQQVRSGPFLSLGEARHRLLALAPAMKTLNLQPIIVYGAALAFEQAPTFIADARKPE